MLGVDVEIVVVAEFTTGLVMTFGIDDLEAPSFGDATISTILTTADDAPVPVAVEGDSVPCGAKSCCFRARFRLGVRGQVDEFIGETGAIIGCRLIDGRLSATPVAIGRLGATAIGTLGAGLIED